MFFGSFCTLIAARGTSTLPVSSMRSVLREKSRSGVMTTSAPGRFAAWKSLPWIFTFSTLSAPVPPLIVSSPSPDFTRPSIVMSLPALIDACIAPSRSWMPTCGTSAFRSRSSPLPVMRGEEIVPPSSTLAEPLPPTSTSCGTNRPMGERSATFTIDLAVERRRGAAQVRERHRRVETAVAVLVRRCRARPGPCRCAVSPASSASSLKFS